MSKGWIRPGSRLSKPYPQLIRVRPEAGQGLKRRRSIFNFFFSTLPLGTKYKPEVNRPLSDLGHQYNPIRDMAIDGNSLYHNLIYGDARQSFTIHEKTI